MLKIYNPIKIIFIVHKRKKDGKKMMADYLKIRSRKYCAVYNKQVTAY